MATSLLNLGLLSARGGLVALALLAGCGSTAAGPQFVDGTPVTASDRIVPPELVSRVEPLFPTDFQDLDVGGSVRLRIAVSEAGDVTEIRVLQASNAPFEREARQAVRQWKFKPATFNGQPKAAYFVAELVFNPSR